MGRIRDSWLWLLKNTLNRFTSWCARRGIGPFSLVRHVGRKSGKTFETPLILAAVPGGFVAELTYGENVNWYRNIVKAGGCEVVVKRVTHRVVAIEPYPAEDGRRAFGRMARVVLKLAGLNEFRLLRTAD